MLWSTRKVQSHRFQFALRALNACLLYLLLAVLSVGSVLAMSPPPPEPSPDPIIPQIDPKPETPKLSIGLSGTDIRLNWRNAQNADYYPVYAYAEGDWYHVEDIYGTAVTYDHKQYGWDMRELQFKILACKAKPWYVTMWAWEWGDNKRCSEYSNSVQLPLLDPTFSLSSTVVTLNTLPSLAGGIQTVLSGSQGSQGPLDDSVDTLGAIRSIVATLRLKDSITQESKDIRWPIYLNTETFEVTSNKTIAVVPGTYDVEFLATDGDVDYVARALNITLTETQQNIPLVLRTVLGDTDVTIDTVINLPEFQFQYDPAELTDFTQPKIGVVIDGSNEVLLTLNPATGITDQYLSISAGQHNIQLTFYDGVLIKGRSDPAQENPNIVPGESFVMDLIPLHGETTISLDTVGGDATFTFAIPTIAVEEVGGNPDNLQVVLSLVGLNNQPEDVILSNLTYNATSDVYEAQHTYTGMQADTQMTLSLSFTDLSTEPDQLLGSCVMDNFVLNSDPRSLPCQLTLRRRAIVGGHLLAVLGINVFDAINIPVSGASVYAKRQGTETENEDQDEDLGTLLGLTGSGSFGTSGYLKAYLVPGSYQLSAKYVPIDGSAQETITLSAFDVENQDLILDKSLDQTQPPSITLTTPAEDATADSSYNIQWIASAPDNQAKISLYFDTNNSNYDGELITNGLVEGTDNSYLWDTSAIPEGDYYLYAVISDGLNEAKAYSAQPLTIDHDHGLVMDCSSVLNNYGGRYNAPNYCNVGAMALLNPTESSIHAWGNADRGGTSATADEDYEKVYSTGYAFAALNADGYITAWGDSEWGGVGAPIDNGYIRIYSTEFAFAALKADGSITAWGDGGSNAPTDSGYTAIYLHRYAFAALKADGSIRAWGHSGYGGEGEPTDNGYIGIYSNSGAFAALKDDGSIRAWGYEDFGGTGAPTDSGYTAISSTNRAFAALKADGSISAWGEDYYGGNSAPSDNGYTQIYSSALAFAALKTDGSISTWGASWAGAPTDDGYTKIYSNGVAFVALKTDGSITAWGSSDQGGTGAPTDSGYTKIYSADRAFAALKSDGSITAWGHEDWGGTGAPTDSGYISIYSTNQAFTAIKADGTVFSWGDSEYGGSGAPANLNDTPSQNQNQNYQLKLNDTGTTWGSEYPSGNNSTCTGETITQQDCSHGRDAQAAAGTLTKVGGGVAGFDFTRLNADGSDYTGSGDYNSQPWACVRDNHTGLVWEVKTDDGGIHDKNNTYRWGGKTALINQQARDDGWGEFFDDWNELVDGSNSANSGSGLCGFTNWRVPTVYELTGISLLSGTPSTIDTDYFPNTVPRKYWSSLPYCYDYGYGLYVNNDPTSIAHYALNYRNDYFGVRLVVGEQLPVFERSYSHIQDYAPDSRYIIHGDSTVTDIWTGLMWQRCSLGQTWDGSTCTGIASDYTWQGALRQGESNSFAGYSDWRLPNIKEMHSLVNYSVSDPAINRTVFPNNGRDYWSSSLEDSQYWAGWYIDFYYGIGYRTGLRGSYAVRLVRDGQ